MEIYNKKKNGYIEVWLTNQEQEEIDRTELTQQILFNVQSKKCRIIFFLSGKEDIYKCTENLITSNVLK